MLILLIQENLTPFVGESVLKEVICSCGFNFKPINPQNCEETFYFDETIVENLKVC